ncbi:hypothetical protein RUMTOR_01078 [[Ruminococcus] torques ATCC 27756]|uniref:Uncharacterized protein n=1 Tax=[Ruminococcus] torques ATCC 27756 TaxID=411460 RepID=A5KLH4_9FIRM|nr:hypothetical protein RUMTOR_01078 [[Ruminococcus] torques ATCC 27756]
MDFSKGKIDIFYVVFRIYTRRYNITETSSM